MQTLEPFLAEHPFFKDFPQQHLKLLVGCASNVRFDEGKFIFREGQEANNFYLIRHGRVALEISVAPRPPIVLKTLEPGEILGWSWLIPPYHWMMDARATELTRAIALDGACLRKKCQEDCGLGYELLKRFAHVMEEELQAARLQLIDVYGAPEPKGPP
jgi:CRP/FNR family transcriptional regulator, cyclic AMP receptor protein